MAVPIIKVIMFMVYTLAICNFICHLIIFLYCVKIIQYKLIINMKNKEIILTIIIVILLLWILLNSSKEGMQNSQINKAFKKIGAKVKNAPNNRGVIVTEITPGGSFDKAGLKVGDVIINAENQVFAGTKLIPAIDFFVDFVNNNSSYIVTILKNGGQAYYYHINS